MKKRKIWVSIALASACLFSLAACGKTEEPTPTPTPTATATPTATPTSTPSASSSTSTQEAEQGFTITFNSNGKTVTDLPDALANQTAIPSNLTGLADIAGSKFVGWGLEATSTTPVEAGTAINAETTLYAIWQSSISMNGTNYATIAEAFAAIPKSGDTSTYTITLPKGTYEASYLNYNGSATIKISGDTTTKYGADVIIKGHGNKMDQERGRELLEIQGTGNLILENLTLESDYLRNADRTGDVQSEVLGTDTKGTTMAYNCSFKSHQDTIRTTGKAWFYGCYIEGDTDFMWMEQAGVVALYEKCEIVSVFDEYASKHKTYIAAPGLAIKDEVGKGLVIYNSIVKESDAAKTGGQLTYLARTPWSSGKYNQVAYINTQCEGIETEAQSGDAKSNSAPWYGTQIATEYAKTVIGWKMDQATATSIGYTGNEDILDADTVSKEFSGRKAILNRIYNTGKQKYEKDITGLWDIDAAITANGWEVDADTSTELLPGESTVEPTIYKFDGLTDYSSLCNGFSLESGKTHYRGGNGSTITIPVSGKAFVQVFGYYQGKVEVTAGTQGKGVMFFNNGSTNNELKDTYVVYQEDAGSVVITAKSTTYITKIIVTEDSSIEQKPVTSMAINGSTTNYCVGVALNLSVAITPSDATNKCVTWSSNNELVGTIDADTGKVTFVAPGEVTFTATALDGSNTTQTITCNPIAATWTACEWYTKDDDLAAETKATEIGNFGVNSSEKKVLSAATTYKNLNGEPFTTSTGLKLNGNGKLTISTTEAATLTVVCAQAGKDFEAPKVSNGTTTITNPTEKASGNDSIKIYVYTLADPGTWNIERAGTSEVNPILYAKCVYNYDAKWDFQQATPSTITSVNIQGTTGTVVSNLETVKLTVDATCDKGKLEYNASGYAQFNNGTIIKVPVVNVGSIITTVSYSGQSKYTIGPAGEGQTPATVESDTDTYTVTEADVVTGYVEIIATGGAYLYSITLTNPR